MTIGSGSLALGAEQDRAHEDARIARWLWLGALAGVVLAAPMFLSHFRAASTSVQRVGGKRPRSLTGTL